MNTPNNDFFPWDDINENDELPTGCYHMKIHEVYDGHSQSSGKRMPRVSYQVVEPREYAGIFYSENYVCGSDENPEGFVAGTMGCKGLKRMLKAAQVPGKQNAHFMELITMARGAELLVNISYKPDADFKNNITSYSRIGEKTPGLAPTGGTGVGKPNLPKGPGPSVPPSPTQSPQTAPVQPPVQPQPMAAPMPQTPPTPQATPVQPTPAAAAPAEPMINCTICGQAVPSSQLGAHVAGHAQQG